MRRLCCMRLKQENVMYDYIRKTGFQDNFNRATPASNTLKKITNQKFSTPIFELPDGSIEMKATWRRYDSSAR